MKRIHCVIVITEHAVTASHPLLGSLSIPHDGTFKAIKEAIKEAHEFTIENLSVSAKRKNLKITIETLIS